MRVALKKGFLAIIPVLLLAVLPGCGSKPNVKGKLADLEAAFPSNAETNSEGIAAHDAAALVQAGLEAARQNDFAGSVIALQSAQGMTATPEQLQTVHDAMQALTTDLVERAAHGDAKAQADLATIERTRSQ